MNKTKFTLLRLFVVTFLLCCLMTIQTPAAPTLLGNGKIAFTSDRDGNSEIYLMNADGSGQTRLTNNSVRDDYPTWSPDGRTIAFVRQNGSVFSINQMNVDGTNQTPITTITLNSNFSYPYEFFSMSWSPDGAKIAFQDSRDIFTTNVDGSNRTNLTNAQFSNYEPSWSPDGSRIAFARSIYSHGAYTEIYTMNINGGDVRRITTSEAYCESRSPDWSPDGGQIALADWINIDPYSISSVNPDGTNLQRVLLFDGGANAPVNNMPKWSPDGTKVVFYRNGYSDYVSQIWVMNRNGSGLTQLTNTSPNNFHPDWQPQPELAQSSLTVTRNDDRNNATCAVGDCSLREAVNATNASATDDTISFASNLTTVTLTSGISINKTAGTLTINGRVANVFTIDGGVGTNRIFNIFSANITISGVTLTGGNGNGAGIPDGFGGAIVVYGNSLTLDGVHVMGNSALGGQFAGYGGGINFQGGTNFIINSTISGNSAKQCGGFDNFGTLTIVNSTISGNTATNFGGGFCTDDYDVTLRNVTITNNAASSGGGIFNFSTCNFSNAIVAGNTATSGGNPEFGYRGCQSAGGNLVGDSPGDSPNLINYQPTDIRDVNPMFGALQYNGGTTPTHALLAGSPAIDKGLNALVSPIAPVFDQRGTGFARIRDGNGAAIVDIGAFEVQPGATTARRTLFDFDGDGRADLSVFRPSDRTWYLNQSTAGFSAAQFGLSTDKLTPADFDGDGKTDISVYRDGVWYLRRSQLGFAAITFGLAEDVPQPADFDGDGKAEIAVWRPSNGVWYVFNLATNQFTSFQLGASTDKPVVGDYDGDGRADFAIFSPSNGTWNIQQSTAGFVTIPFGTSTNKLVPADYDGDGKTDIAVYRDGVWYIRQTSGAINYQYFGLSSDAPTNRMQ